MNVFDIERADQFFHSICSRYRKYQQPVPGINENTPGGFPPGVSHFTEKSKDYSMILATTPAPTVRPPSRMAKRRPSSMAIGAISWTVIDTLSPGITISVPSGR